MVTVHQGGVNECGTVKTISTPKKHEKNIKKSLTGFFTKTPRFWVAPKSMKRSPIDHS